tara:strand:- start:299 stop:841 length:543 start_codon:yes stop_codon:yes gene_type:complete
MTKRRSRRKSPKARKAFQLNLPNFVILSLSGIVAFAMFSIVDKVMFSDDKLDINSSVDLETLLTVSSYEKETGYKIEVQILNGCGIKNLAAKYERYIRKAGHDVVDTGNALHFNYSRTEVILRRGEIERAKQVTDLLNISKADIKIEYDENLMCDVTVIIGEDYESLDSFSDVLAANPSF